METQEQVIYQLSKDISAMLQSPPAYMREITRVSQKVVSIQIKYLFFVVNNINHILHDPSQPIKKKLFAIRFLKDTLLLASHSFYVLTVIRILPFMVEVLSQGNKQTDNGLEYLISRIQPRPDVSNPIEIKTFSTTLLQLISEIVKWTGTHIKMHPFYKVPFTSIFKLCLDELPKVKAIKITDLTYFTTDSINVYEQNCMQKQLRSDTQNRKQSEFIQLLVNNWISLPEDDEEKQGSLKLLQNIVQTGDSLLIYSIITCLKPLIESSITGFQAIQVVHQLLKVKELQFFTLVRDQLMPSVTYYVIMMSKEKFSQLQSIDLLQILGQVHVWKIYCEKLGLKTETIEEFFKKTKNEWIFSTQTDYTSRVPSIQQSFEKFQYFLSQAYLLNINQQKKLHLKLKDDLNTINKIRWLDYKKKQNNGKVGSFFDDKNQEKSSQSISSRRNDQNKSKGNSFAEILKDEKLSFYNFEQVQNVQSPSPIKQLQMNNYGQQSQNTNKKPSLIKQEYIKFNNSLNNLSSSKEPAHPQIDDEFPKNNIYTAKQTQLEDKRSVLSRRSNGSNKSSKKSLGKLEKVSSLGFGVQKVKSSKMIDIHTDDYYQAKITNQNDENGLGIGYRKPQKPNLIKFNDSSSHSLKNDRLQSPQQNHSLSSDNNPYKQQHSESIHTNHKNNLANSQSVNKRLLKNQEIIIVEQTVRKPKFGFVRPELDQDFTDLSSPKKLGNKKTTDNQSSDFSESFSQSIKVDPQLISQDKLSKYSSIPSDFNAALGLKRKKVAKNSKDSSSDNDSQLNVKFNKYPHKVKQLQMQIQRAKQYQRLYQQKMKEKDQQYDGLVKNLPQGHDKVHQQNQKLSKELEEKQKKQVERMIRKEERLYKSPDKRLKSPDQIPFLPQKIFKLEKVKPYEPGFIKQMISNKCLLEKNQIFELGYAFKRLSQEQAGFLICLYFKFKVPCERLSFKLVDQGLIMKEPFEGKVVNIVANKQLKFEQKIVGYKVKNENFKIPYLQVEVHPQNGILQQLNKTRLKQKQPILATDHQLTIPCSLLNFLDFHTPLTKPQAIKTKYATSPLPCTPQLTTSLQGEYLLNSFRCGKWHQPDQNEGGFYVSFYSYIKDIKNTKILKDKEIRVLFEEFKYLERREICLCIKKVKGGMFYVESDNQFEADKVVLVELCRVLGR